MPMLNPSNGAQDHCCTPVFSICQFAPEVGIPTLEKRNHPSHHWPGMAKKVKPGGESHAIRMATGIFPLRHRQANTPHRLCMGSGAIAAAAPQAAPVATDCLFHDQ